MKSSRAQTKWTSTIFSQPQEKKDVRRCDHPGCTSEGEYRAPQARDRLNEYYWFCLDHVRAYNAAWDFYAGMKEEEIEAAIRKDTIWQRPTWPLGANGAARARVREFRFSVHDPFEVFDEAAPAAARQMSPEDEARIVLQFERGEPLTPEGLKLRYKELVKRHHPDANGGDKLAEERFKRINQAYNTLKAALSA